MRRIISSSLFLVSIFQLIAHLKEYSQEIKAALEKQAGDKLGYKLENKVGI